MSSWLDDYPNFFIESILLPFDVKISFIILIIFYYLIDERLTGLNNVLAMPIVVFIWDLNIELSFSFINLLCLCDINLIISFSKLAIKSVWGADPLLNYSIFMVVAISTKSGTRLWSTVLSLSSWWLRVITAHTIVDSFVKKTVLTMPVLKAFMASEFHEVIRLLEVWCHQFY